MIQQASLIATLAISLAAAYAGGMIATRLKLPALVGYLLAGVVVGPFTPGVNADPHLAAELAEIGVILLMFGVGLHFSVKDLLAVRHIALPGAIAQIAIATGLGFACARMWGWPAGEGLLFGLALSVASTVVLLRALDAQGRVASSDGRIAVGWLIVEDLAMVLALVLLPALAPALGGHGHGLGHGALALAVASTVGKVALFVAFMLAVGTRFFPKVLARVARLGDRELFTLTILATALGVAYFSAEFFHVSFALGAFFAGMVVGSSELSHQVADDIVPMRDAFAVLFFVSVGMLFNPHVLLEAPWHVLMTVAIVVVGKSLAAFAIVLAFRYPLGTALTVSASLAQIGEFSFILAALGVSLGLMSPLGQSLVLAGAIASITLNPLVFWVIQKFDAWLLRLPSAQQMAFAAEHPAPAIESPYQDHVVLVGHGRVGALVARALEEAGLPTVIVERDRRLAEALRDEGREVVFGDAARQGTLAHVGLERARLLVSTSQDPFEAPAIVARARALNPRMCLVVRTDSLAERDEAARLGADVAVFAEEEVAKALIHHAMKGLADEEGCRE